MIREVSSAPNMKYYAVRVGRKCGVFKSWAECEAQTKGFKGAEHKSFKTLVEAQEFVGSAKSKMGQPAKVTLQPSSSLLSFTTTTATAMLSSASASSSSPSSSLEPSFRPAKRQRADEECRSKTPLSMATKVAIYTDGSCLGNKNVREQEVPAGWAAVVMIVATAIDKMANSGGSGSHHDSSSAADCDVSRAKEESLGCSAVELYGPVVTPAMVASHPPLKNFAVGAEVGSNNTGELCGIIEALYWVRDQVCGPSPACPYLREVDIRYDSQYAARSTTGEYNGEKNRALIHTARRALAQATQTQSLLNVKSTPQPSTIFAPVFSSVPTRPQQVKVTFTHVKGHSGDHGNERADALAKFGGAGNCCSTGRWNSLCASKGSCSTTTTEGDVRGAGVR